MHFISEQFRNLKDEDNITSCDTIVNQDQMTYTNKEPKCISIFLKVLCLIVVLIEIMSTLYNFLPLIHNVVLC